MITGQDFTAIFRQRKLRKTKQFQFLERSYQTELKLAHL